MATPADSGSTLAPGDGARRVVAGGLAGAGAALGAFLLFLTAPAVLAAAAWGGPRSGLAASAAYITVAALLHVNKPLPDVAASQPSMDYIGYYAWPPSGYPIVAAALIIGLVLWRVRLRREVSR